MSFLKKYTVLLVLLLLVSIPLSAQQNSPLIIIDIAHSSIDQGTTANSDSERELLKGIAGEIESFNETSNLKFHLIGLNDMSLSERIQKLNSLQPQLVISLHINTAEDEGKSGTEIYYTENQFKEKSVNLAQIIERSINQTALPVNQIRKSGYKLLKEVQAPAIMVELGYISNASDRAYLKSKKGQQEIAKRLFFAFNQ
ncbi:MAG: N-acetylmuramoyl-L-alanine amidase [Bacteroidota bacterium]